MPTETDQKLRSEILNLFQYVQRLREEIGCIVQQPDGQTRFGKMSDQLDAILTSTGEATHTVLEDLEAILSTAEEMREMPDPAKVEELCDRIPPAYELHDRPRVVGAFLGYSACFGPMMRFVAD
jgi:hypothetical protein